MPPRVTKAAKAAAAAAANMPQAQTHAGSVGPHAVAAFAPVVSASASAPAMGRVVDVENFKKVRDSALERLQMLSALVQNFCTDYLHQTNLLIGLESEHDNHVASGMLPANLVPSMVPMMHLLPHLAAEEKKERKKRVHDPNAPKRPLTPYFLYMQTARPIIANDLGPGVPKGAVQDEGQRRWSVMTVEEKEGWNRAYAYNLRLYQARCHAYKNGNLDAKNMTDDESRIYADIHNIEAAANAAHPDLALAKEQEAIAHQLQEPNSELAGATASEHEEDDAEDDDEPAPVPEPPAKTSRSTKGGRKRKGAEPADVSAATLVAPEATPEPKKRKRTSKALEADEVKKSSRKKKST